MPVYIKFRGCYLPFYFTERFINLPTRHLCNVTLKNKFSSNKFLHNLWKFAEFNVFHMQHIFSVQLQRTWTVTILAIFGSTCISSKCIRGDNSDERQRLAPKARNLHMCLLKSLHKIGHWCKTLSMSEFN